MDYRAESLAAFKTFREKHGSRRNDDGNEEERGRMLEAQRQQILERSNKRSVHARWPPMLSMRSATFRRSVTPATP